ncbi:cysteine desulfurase family protein [Pseudactinotalea terrae]|uniref:cysteine desulfurase family protein n=1 Tax=Pseudactinotalea terrae TaxID=1743262 RepID=UPI001F5005FB|nr:cysteine desulfurase family protein [Pseudactinotalea terrae]
MTATYLDHAATTVVRDEVAHAYAEDLRRLGNPSSVHSFGREARRVLEESREQLAADLGAHPTEVIFTAGGTEADNLAVVGGFHAARGTRPAVAISAVEHHAVLDAAHWLGSAQGAEVTELAVDREGVLDLDALTAYLASAAERTAVLAVMWANNETGALQPVREVVAAAGGVAVHTDAVQALGHVPLDFAEIGVTTLALSGHKVGAPVGVGALLARRDAALAPVLHGGGQERGIRSGTLDAAGARALALAVRLAVAEQASEQARLGELRDRLQAGVLAAIPEVSARSAGADRLPGHLLLTIPGTDADAVLFGLDAAGVAASSGSACTAGVTQPSHVLLAMGDDVRTARSAVRFTLGRTTTEADIDRVLAVLPGVVERARAANLPRQGASVTRSGQPRPAGEPAPSGRGRVAGVR